MNKIIFTICLLCIAISAKCQDESMSSIPGAKMYFSDKPFTNNHDGNKTSFKSSDFIYGRIVLGHYSLLCPDCRSPHPRPKQQPRPTPSP